MNENSEKLFKETAMKDLQKVNDLCKKDWYGTSDFNEAVDSLIFSLSVFLQSQDLLEEESA